MMFRACTLLCALWLLSPLAWATPATQPVVAFAGKIDLARGKDEGARLEMALAGMFRPRADAAPWPLAPPLDWDADPFADPNWRFQLHAWRMLDPLVLAYLGNADPALMDRMLVTVRDWKRYHVDEGRTSEFANYDMALGLRAQKLAWLYVALGESGREAERADLIVPLALRARDALLAQVPFSSNNHGLFQAHGLLALCRAGATDCGGSEDVALAEFERLLGQQFKADSGHVEHSPAYHFFALKTFRRMLGSGWYARAARALAILDGAQAASVWLSDPAGNLFSVGDSDSSPAPRSSPPAADCVLRSDGVCHLLRTFPETGWAIARSAWDAPAAQGSALFFQASHHSATHKHADDLSFVWFDRGRPVLVDPGRFGYVHDPLRDYMSATRAHNALEIDGRSQRTGGDAAFGSALLPSEVTTDAIVLSAAMHLRRDDTHHRRTLVYRPQRMLLVLDSMRSAIEHDYAHWFQFGSDAVLLPDASAGMRTLRFDNGSELHLLLSRDDCSLGAHRGEKQPLQGWITTSYARAAPALSLVVRCRGADSRLGVAFVWQTADLALARTDMTMHLARLASATRPLHTPPQQESIR